MGTSLHVRQGSWGSPVIVGTDDDENIRSKLKLQLLAVGLELTIAARYAFPARVIMTPGRRLRSLLDASATAYLTPVPAYGIAPSALSATAKLNLNQPSALPSGVRTTPRCAHHTGSGYCR